MTSLWLGHSSGPNPGKLSDVSEEMKTVSVATEFSCTAPKCCKEETLHCQFTFSSEFPWEGNFPSLDVPLETADAESIKCIKSPLSL